MRKIILFFLGCIFCLSSIAINASENNGRWIDIEWDEVDGAKGYDIELFELIDKKEFSRGIFHSDSPHWSKETAAGKYNVRIRALDSRKVPGAWGEAIPVAIKLLPTQLIKPFVDEEFATSEIDDLIINFQWSIVSGAGLYQLIVFNSNNKIILNTITKEIEFKKSINKIDKYKWIVIPLFTSEEKKDIDEVLDKDEYKSLFKKFSIKGQMLKSPILDIEIFQERGIVFKWNEIFRAKKYSYDIFKIDENKDLKKIISSDTDRTQVAIKKDKFSNGKYIFSVKAQSLDYKESESSKVSFNFENSQFEIVNNESLTKEMMNRPTETSSIEGQFGYPSYNYTSRYYETDTYNQETLRGIRVQGKWRSNLSENRYQNILKFDIAEAADSYTATRLMSFSENIGKSINFYKSHYYISAGIRFDSTPIIYADRFTQAVTSKNIKFLSPELNFQYRYRLGLHWGTEFKATAFLPFFRISNNDGSKLKSTFNYDTELKLMYSINGQFDFYTGLNHTSHDLKTTAVTGVDSFALSSDIDEVKINSTYLIFGAEFFY